MSILVNLAVLAEITAEIIVATSETITEEEIAWKIEVTDMIETTEMIDIEEIAGNDDLNLLIYRDRRSRSRSVDRRDRR